MATLSSILTWKILWTEEPGRQQSTGLQRVERDLATNQQQTLKLLHCNAPGLQDIKSFRALRKRLIFPCNLKQRLPLPLKKKMF